MRFLLESEGFAVETYASAREFLDAPVWNGPGCLILDLRMPDTNGLDLQQQLRAREDSPPVIFVSGHGDVPRCAQAMKAGALDFLVKPADDDQLLALVRLALDQHREQRQRLARVIDIRARTESLTHRERETMTLMLEGKEMKRIAATFGVSIQTVAKHRARVLAKMSVRNDAELINLLGASASSPRSTEP
jgi:FixJ family two-component response regulator